MEGKKEEEYLEILYPGNRNEKENFYFTKEYDKTFIHNNIDEINKYYKRFVENKEFYGEEWQQLTELELMRKAIDEAKARYYFNALNPEKDFEGGHLVHENITEDIDFIYEHLYEIEEEYLELLKEKEKKYQSWNENELLDLALRNIKGKKYFYLLYPEYEETEKTNAHQLRAGKELEFIFSNLDEIDKEYRKNIHERAKNGDNIDKLTETGIIKTVINMVKSRILSEKETKENILKEGINPNKTEKMNKPEEGIEELLNKLEAEKIEENGINGKNEANEYDIEISTKQILTTKDFANADMKAGLTSSDIARKKNFINRVLDKMRVSSGR